MQDFGGVGLVPMLKAIVSAIPPFFSITIFAIWLFATAGSYMAIAQLTGRKRFWNALTAMSFISFLLSLVIVAMNEVDFTFLSGYWVGFYILMTMGSWYMMSNYK
jgi:hypothetical protein